MNQRSQSRNQRGREAGEETKKPVASFGPYGTGSALIEAAVWRNVIEGDDKKDIEVFSVSVTKSYKQGDEWKRSTSFRQHEIPVIQYALGKAYEWLMDEKTDE